MNIDTPIVGIDLGTTKSVIAIWDPQQKMVVTIPNREKSPITPSVVTFDPNTGEAVVGEPAVAEMLVRPEDVIYSVKRFIGLTYDDPNTEASRKQVTYRIEGTPENKVIIRAAGQVLVPQQVSRYVLEKLKKDAEACLGRPVNEAVITVPAYFTESQRHATISAGSRAGLKVRRLINEPTAAALAFNLDAAQQNVVVFDMGGGTFDVSVIEIKNGFYRVIATKGDTHLGGDDFDMRIVKWIKDEFRREVGTPLLADPAQEAMLRSQSRRAKEDLAKTSRITFQFPNLQSAAGEHRDFTREFTSQQLQALTGDLVERALDICADALKSAEEKTAKAEQPVTAARVRKALLVGGQTLSPLLREALQARFGWELDDSVPPSEAVARGAAIQAGFLSMDPYLLGRMRLWDVIAQPLGVEDHQGRMTQMINANQQIPVRNKITSKKFTNPTAGKQIDFLVFQGSDPVASKNNYLGRVTLPLAGDRKPEEALVECWFEIDFDGILEVHAKELGVESEEVVEKIDYFYYLNQEKGKTPVG